MAGNRKVLEEYIKNHFRAGAFNTCKRQHWPITAGPPMKIHTPPEAPRTYCRRPTEVLSTSEKKSKPAWKLMSRKVCWRECMWVRQTLGAQ
jgi:hypothetical protein